MLTIARVATRMINYSCPLLRSHVNIACYHWVSLTWGVPAASPEADPWVLEALIQVYAAETGLTECESLVAVTLEGAVGVDADPVGTEPALVTLVVVDALPTIV